MVYHPPWFPQWLHYKPKPMASHPLTPPPTGKERSIGGPEEGHGWHCGMGARDVDRALPPGKKQRQATRG